MNILFITVADIRKISEGGIYADLMVEFAKNNHNVWIVSPAERRCKIKSGMYADKDYTNIRILKIKTGNIQKTNILEKGISTILIEGQIKRGIKKYLKDTKFDLVLYSTPPITLIKPVKYVKKRDNAKSYLMLKDIFPQNAVDLKMLAESGLRGLLHRYFRKKEKQLYNISDRIGCMSQANVDYVLSNNPEITVDKVEICPNAIYYKDLDISLEEKKQMRVKYGIPLDKTVFVYGGNLGKPQGIPFIQECLNAEKENPNVFFLIVGNGTEYSKLDKYIKDNRLQNVKLMAVLPREDYDRLAATCDVGLIFLDYRFTIPNYPSRLLSYLQTGLPVLAVTDINTDIGKNVETTGAGWSCFSNDIEGFSATIRKILAEKGQDYSKGIDILKSEYSVEKVYKLIANCFQKG